MSQVTKLTIDSSKIAADLTDFPVYVDLADLPSDFWGTVKDKVESNNLSGGNFTTTDSNSNEGGYYIRADKNCFIEEVEINSTGTGTTAKIVDNSKNLIASASFSGKIATFSTPVELVSGNNYYVVVVASTRPKGNKSSVPRARTDITYVDVAYAVTAGNLSTLVNSGISEDINIYNIKTFTPAGGDIRVFKSDGTTELPREVVSCDTSTETGELHFKYTGTLSSSVDTEVQIHADGTSADYAAGDTYGSDAVWSGYKGIWHVQANSTDSTVNGYDGTDADITYTTGKIEDGADYNGTSSKITLANNFNANYADPITISAWVKKDTTYPDRIFFQGNGASTSYYGYHCYDLYMDETQVQFSYIPSDGNVSDATGAFSASTGEWYYVTLAKGVGGPTTWNLYVNGVQLSTTTTTNSSNNLPTVRETFIGHIHRYYSGGSPQNAYGWNDGILDEVRFSTGQKSSDWIETEYNNQNSPSTFYTAESPVTTSGNFFLLF
jgi:hypothetical protein